MVQIKKNIPGIKIFKKLLIPLFAVFLGLTVGSLLVISRDTGLLDILGYLIYGAFGSLENLSESLIYTIPLGLSGLAIAFSYSAGVFNIGCEGQLQLAAAAATLVATSTAFANPFLHVFISIVAGIAAGALWALIPGLLKAYRGFNEIVVTMLLNYIAILLVSFFVHGPLKDPAGYYAQSKVLADTARLTHIFSGYNLHTGFWLFLLCTIIITFILYRTSLGFKLRSTGYNIQASRYAGIKVKRIMVLSMLVSGGLAGIAGSVEIMGVHGRLMEGFSPGYGYDAIAVCLIANLNPVGILFSSFFFGALRNAAGNLQIEAGIPVSFVYIIQGLAILFVIGSRGLPRYIGRLRRRFAK
ncbi:MAG: ABC transporter permease [Spirochaetales bacterium]|nr:ABC transporter permease [Spirochaetales bacterium]